MPGNMSLVNRKFYSAGKFAGGYTGKFSMCDKSNIPFDFPPWMSICCRAPLEARNAPNLMVDGA